MFFRNDLATGVGSICAPAGVLASHYQLAYTGSQPAYLFGDGEQPLAPFGLLRNLKWFVFLARPVFLLLRYQVEALSVGAFVPCLR